MLIIWIFASPVYRMIKYTLETPPHLDSHSLPPSLSPSLSLIQKVESTNMKISTVPTMQLPFVLLLGNIRWENKWNLAATFITKSLEIPLLNFESSWDILIFSHFPDFVINQGSPLCPCNACLICINKYWERGGNFFSVSTRNLSMRVVPFQFSRFQVHFF